MIPDNILQVENLNMSFKIEQGLFQPKKQLQVLHDLTFTVKHGKTLAVVGESGSGKSTLAKILAGIEPNYTGNVVIDDIPLDTGDSEEKKLLRQKARLIFQNPYASLNPRMRVRRQLEEPLLINTNLTEKQRRQLIDETILRVGLRPEQLDRYPDTFSGGQRQRIAIAHALILAPQLVIADEPLSALDVSVQAQILNLLTDLQDEMGLSYIFITHDLSVVRYISDQIMVLYKGHIMEFGESEIIFNNPLHPYTMSIMESSHHLHKLELMDIKPSDSYYKSSVKGCPYALRCPKASVVCVEQMPKQRQYQQRTIACHNV